MSSSPSGRACGERAEGGSRKTEVRRQRSEDRGQKSEGRNQRSEGRGQELGNRKNKITPSAYLQSVHFAQANDPD